MGKRANIRATARNTAALVHQGRAAELREQGLIGHNASPAEVRAVDRRLLKAATAERRRVAQDQADPRGQLIFTSALVVILVPLALLFASVVFWWITAILIAAGVVSIVTASSEAEKARERRSNHTPPGV